MNAPTGLAVAQDDYTVDVLGHDYECIDRRVREVQRNLFPVVTGDLTVLAQHHFIFTDMAKNAP